MPAALIGPGIISIAGGPILGDVTPTGQLSSTQRDQSLKLQEKATECWGQPNHPGWGIRHIPSASLEGRPDEVPVPVYPGPDKLACVNK